jgi:hypothetical protein
MKKNIKKWVSNCFYVRSEVQEDLEDVSAGIGQFLKI